MPRKGKKVKFRRKCKTLTGKSNGDTLKTTAVPRPRGFGKKPRIDKTAAGVVITYTRKKRK